MMFVVRYLLLSITNIDFGVMIDNVGTDGDSHAAVSPASVPAPANGSDSESGKNAFYADGSDNGIGRTVSPVGSSSENVPSERISPHQMRHVLIIPITLRKIL